MGSTTYKLQGGSMREHESAAVEIGKRSVEEDWTMEVTQLAIMKLMEKYGHQLSGEVSKAFAQGIMAAGRKDNKNE